MEDLNKTQTILMALLVSFVSSVAVSIMTFSLLNEEPTTVIQTVNRVVEKTIETVVPSQSKTEIVTKETTVVVKEEDLIIDAISQNEKSLIRIFEKIGEEKLFVSFGLILGKEGLLASPKGNFSVGALLSGTLHNNSEVVLTVVSSGDNFSFFKIEDLTDIELKESLLGNSDNLQLGQTIISINGEDRNTISVGRITGLLSNAEKSEGEIETTSSGKFSSIESDLKIESSGSPAINLKGEIVGINMSEENTFLPINILKEEVVNLGL